MPRTACFTTKPIQDLFRDEISRMGGTVRDSFDDGQRLFARDVLTNFRPVALNDDVQAGVALRADEQQICVHPYIFRLVCKNGAIWAHALESIRIEEPAAVPTGEFAVELGAAIRSCGSPGAFETGVREMQSAQSRGVDLALQLSALLSGMGSGRGRHLLGAILDNYSDSSDASRFSLMNAITAVARDTDDPETKWRLEEFGAGVPVGYIPPSLKPGNALSLQRVYSSEVEERPADLTLQMDEQYELVTASR